jgi:hypothetical protein
MTQWHGGSIRKWHCITHFYDEFPHSAADKESHHIAQQLLMTTVPTHSRNLIKKTNQTWWFGLFG